MREGGERVSRGKGWGRKGGNLSSEFEKRRERVGRGGWWEGKGG